MATRVAFLILAAHPGRIYATADAAGTVAAAPDPTFRLRNGVEMPFVALGVGGYNGTQAATAVRAALQAGIRSIDTAFDYGNNAAVGEALVGVPRGSYFLTTKVPGCGVPTQGLQPPCYNNTLAVAREALGQLRAPAVDLLLLHFAPLLGCAAKSASCAKMREQWRAVEDLHLAGAARAIGVSNYCQGCLACLNETGAQRVAPMVDQMEYHVGMGADPAGLHSYARARGVAVEAYSALGSGRVAGNAAAAAIGAAHGNKSAAQVGLRYLVQRGLPFVTKSLNPAHLAEDLAVFDWNLTTADFAVLDGVVAPACKLEAPGGCCKAVNF